MGTKKTPMRMCTGCREMISKKELMRIVRTPEGKIVSDTTGKVNGRGAYICKKTECLEKVQKSNALSRTFGVAVPSEIYEELKGAIGNIEE